MVPDFLIFYKVPELEAAALVLLLASAGALLSLQALRPSMNALAQNREVRVRLEVMYKTPFVLIIGHLLLFMAIPILELIYQVMRQMRLF